MMFFSTRDSEKKLFTAAQAIKQGLALDGGLFVPEEIPAVSLDEINSLTKKSYPEIAATILSKFLSDYTYDELLEDAKGAYSKEKFGDSAAPVTKLDENISILELWHGPTSAFKDMALQIMPRLFTRAIRKCG